MTLGDIDSREHENSLLSLSPSLNGVSKKLYKWRYNIEREAFCCPVPNPTSAVSIFSIVLHIKNPSMKTSL